MISHRIKYGIQLLFIISIIIVSIIYREEFVKIDLEPTYVTYFFFGCAFIALIMIVTISIAEVFKSSETLKKEKKERINNRIKYYKKIISDLEKEL